MYYQNSGAEWSHSSSDDVDRFEIRSRDQWANDGGRPVERSEIAFRDKMETGQTYVISFSMMIEPGARNTAQWMTLAQIQSTFDPGEAGHSPPFAIEMVGERMRIVTRDSSEAISTPDDIRYVNQYTDQTDITRGTWYDFTIEVKFDPFGDGTLVVIRNGEVLVDFQGALGFNDLVGPYFKQGIYRASADETLAVQYKGLTIVEGSLPLNEEPVSGGTAEGNVPEDKAGEGALDDGQETEGRYINAKGVELLLSGDIQNTVAGTAAKETQTGTSRNDRFYGAGGDTLLGGLGDDTYNLWDADSVAVERPGEGIDTVNAYFWGTATLAENIENLNLMGRGSTKGIGNDLDNIIRAGSVGATLNGMAGDDVLVGGAKGDLFQITAGNGSDTIYGFTSGSDAIQLQGYGITSFSELMSKATQVGKDVRFNFDNGEALVIRDVPLSSLNGFDFGFHIPIVADPGETSMAGAGRAWTANGWYILNNAWGAGDLVENQDFRIEATYNRANMTEDATFSWSFPFTTEYGAPVKAYPELIFGPAPMSGGGKPSDVGGIFPLQVSSLAGLIADVDLSISGNTSGFNVALDVFLTSVPNGDRSTITNEVMIWLHEGDFPPFGNVVGRYSDDTFSGTIYHSGTYTAVVADETVLVGQIDIASIFAELVSLGIISPEEFIASVELGSEVFSGVGSFTVHSLDLEVTTASADGVITTYHTNGSGTTVTESSLAALEGASVILGTEGDDVLEGTAGDDILDGGAGDDILRGGAGDDILRGGPGRDILDGGEGNDTADYSDETEALVIALNPYGDTTVRIGGVATDTLRNIENIIGGSGNDFLTGTSEANVLIGGAGDDTLKGGRGADVLDGGTGVDTVDYAYETHSLWIVLDGEEDSIAYVGGVAEDTLRSIENIIGGQGDDVLIGDDNDNYLYGQNGDDFLAGRGGRDIINGAGGHDTVDYQEKTESVVVTLAVNREATVYVGGVAEDILLNVESVNGGWGDDILIGDTKDNTLNGFAGNDILRGGFGNDTLIGGEGDDDLYGDDGRDVLIGGPGADRLTGGRHIDTFRFESVEDSTPDAMDLITDYQWGEIVDLSAIDADTTRDGDQAFTIVRSLSGKPGELAFSHANGVTTVRGDVDGDGVADFAFQMTGYHYTGVTVDWLL